MRTIRLAALAGLLLLFAAPARAYEISDYRAVFAVQPGNGSGARDVDVHLRIVYQVGDETKSDGFKYVDHARVADLRVSDDDGRPFAAQVKQQRETQLAWNFPPVRSGTQAVNVAFRWQGGASAQEANISLSVPWVGVFRVPVRRATYEVRLPPGSENATIVSPGGGQWTVEDGNRVYRVTQAPLREPGFSVGRTRTTPSSSMNGGPVGAPLSRDPNGPAGAWLQYFLLAVAIVAGGWGLTAWVARSAGAQAPDPSNHRPTPLECACLAGGTNQVVRTALLSLLQKGYLVEEGENVRIPEKKPDVWDRPDPVELALRSYVGNSKPIKEILRGAPQDPSVRTLCGEMEDRLRRAGFYAPAEAAQVATLAGWVGGLLLAGAGFFWTLPRIWSLNSASQTAFAFTPITVFTMAAAIITLAVTTRRAGHLSAAGRRQIEDLKLQHRPTGSPGGQDPEILYWMALFGVTALTTTPYAHLAPIYRPAGSTASAGGCGSGCSSGGGSSCGGGGGCGGGGCGGGCGG